MDTYSNVARTSDMSIYSLTNEAMALITDHLDAPDVLALWSTGDRQIRFSLGRSVARLRIVQSLICTPKVIIDLLNLAPQFVNLVDLSSTYSGHIDSMPTISWNKMRLPKGITNLSLWNPIEGSGDFSGYFSRLTCLTLDECPQKTCRFVFPETLTQLELGQQWRFATANSSYGFTQRDLPRSLTSFTMTHCDFPKRKRRPSYVFTDDWPESLAKLSITAAMPSSTSPFPFKGIVATLPKCLESLSLYRFDAEFAFVIPQEELEHLPPSLTTFATNFNIMGEEASSIFAALPRSLVHLCVPVLAGRDTYTTSLPLLPPSLKSLGITLPRSSKRHSIVAKLIPRSVTRLYDAMTCHGRTPVSSLIHLPAGIRSLCLSNPESNPFIGDDLARFSDLKNLAVDYDGRRNLKTVMRNLPPKLKTLKIGTYPEQPEVELSLFMNLPQHLEHLLLDCRVDEESEALSEIERREVTQDVWSGRLPRRLSRLQLHINSSNRKPEHYISNTPSWWSNLPRMLTRVTITVGVFDASHMAALGETCQSISFINVTAVAKMSVMLIDDIILATPSSCLQLSLGFVTPPRNSNKSFWFRPSSAKHLIRTEKITVHRHPKCQSSFSATRMRLPSGCKVSMITYTYKPPLPRTNDSFSSDNNSIVSDSYDSSSDAFPPHPSVSDDSDSDYEPESEEGDSYEDTLASDDSDSFSHNDADSFSDAGSSYSN